MIWALLLLSILLLMFLLVPVWYQRPQQVTDQSEENLRLYRERTDELAAAEMDDAQKAALQLELDREFLASADEHSTQVRTLAVRQRWPVPVLLLAVVLLGTVALYGFWGAGNELRATRLLQKSSSAELNDSEVTELMGALAQAAQRHPDNLEWAYLYGRINLGQGEFAAAARIFADILVSLPEDAVADRAATLSLLAQARFFAADQEPQESIYALMKESLQLDPGQPQTLGLAGMMAFELGHYRDAIAHWKALWLGLPDTPETQLLVDGMQRAAAHLREQGEQVDMNFLQRVALKVLVDVSAEVRAAFPPATPVFVAARAVSGPPMPLAAQRLTLGDLPQVITLSDAQAMMPGMSLSDFAEVTLIARVSPSGQPVAQAGDWQGQLSPVSNRHEGVLNLTIDQPVR